MIHCPVPGSRIFHAIRKTELTRHRQACLTGGGDNTESRAAVLLLAFWNFRAIQEEAGGPETAG